MSDDWGNKFFDDLKTREDAKRPVEQLVMRAEVRSIRGPTDEYENYLVLISAGKAWPYMHIPDDMPDDVLEAALAKLNA